MRKVGKNKSVPFFALCAGCCLLLMTAAVASAADPVVSNVVAAQRAGTKVVDITYDVADADGDDLTVTVQVSNDGGATYTVPATHFSGDGYGADVSPGTGKKIAWDAGADWNQNYSQQMRFRITANDGGSIAPEGMVLIPAGSFQMGDNFNEGDSDELPVHTVTVSAFYLDKYEVTKALWDEVYTWATANGYSFDNAGAGTAADHPVQTISWYDAIKWLNARSEKEGRTPVYYTDQLQATPFRTGQIDVTNDAVKWTASGYRLPTEAEWEKACRGGLTGNHYPWPSSGGAYEDWIDAGMANYDNNQGGTTPAGYYNGQQTPQGGDMANGYGLYDMAGNVWEWTWDRYASYSSTAATDPKGPDTGSFRVRRGGSWYEGVAGYLRSAYRKNYLPSSSHYALGFRSALSQPTSATLTVTKAGTGGGNVTPDSGAITWAGNIGTAAYTSGTSVILTVAPDAGSAFTSWSGCDSVGGAACTVAMSAAKSVTATFSLIPDGMVLIPAGSFQMGDNFNEGESDEQPVHTVTVSAFYLDKYEVTKALWDEVYTWALANGYAFDNPGSGTAADHPVHTINWYDAIKWLNARSEKEGRTPVYYTDHLQTTPFRIGQINITNSAVKWTANGYRLPTEAEWEKACRGGLTGNHYPWPSSGGVYEDWIDAGMANYANNQGGTTPVGYYNGQQTPQGGDMTNGYGLYDMAGNVWEWTWDWHASYTSTAATDPKGPDTGSSRVLRGGSWFSLAGNLRSAYRFNGTPSSRFNNLGFRSALSQP